MVFNKIILSATALLAYVTSPSILTLSEAATKCGITYTETFSTFSSSVITDSPLVYPKTDAEIADILDNAGKNKCKVRVKGAGQSEVGIIREYKESSDVVVISLAEYTPIASYNKVITPASGDKSATFKISAGATLLDVISTIRPQGYILPTSCAGMFFTVGGMYMNCGNHGSTVDSERFCGHVKSLTAVLATGKSVTLTSDKDVKAWRGSMGYLGVVTAVEFEITADNGIIMALSEFNGTETPYTQVNLNTFWKTNTQTFQAVQWYWNPYTDMMLALTARFNGNQTPFNYTTTPSYYAGLQAQWPDLAKTGGAYNPQSAVYTLINKYYTDKSQAALSATLTYENLKMAWYGNIFYAMDMLYLPPGLVVPFDQVQTYIKCQSDCIDDGVMFDVISSSRTYIQSILGQQFAPWYPTMNLEWRLVTVKADTAVLEFLEPGKYISISFENIRDIDGRSQRHGDFFMGLYNIWQTKGTFRSVHFGKTWAWGKVDGLPDAYPNQESVEVFSKSVKKQFTKLMKKYDKKGLFQAGSILTLLGLGTSTYEPRLTNDKNCYNFKDNQCISGCCCSNPLTCAGNFNKCAAKASCK